MQIRKTVQTLLLRQNLQSGILLYHFPFTVIISAQLWLWPGVGNSKVVRFGLAFLRACTAALWSFASPRKSPKHTKIRRCGDASPCMMSRSSSGNGYPFSTNSRNASWRSVCVFFIFWKFGLPILQYVIVLQGTISCLPDRPAVEEPARRCNLGNNSAAPLVGPERR